MSESGLPERPSRFRGQTVVTLAPTAGVRRCPFCSSGNTFFDGLARCCRDCRSVSRGLKVVIPGHLDRLYRLEVQDLNGDTIWKVNLEALYEAQRDIASGLKVRLRSSFAKWLLSRPNRKGVITEFATIRRMRTIVDKMVRHFKLIRKPFNVDAVLMLKHVLPRAARLAVKWDIR